MKGKKKRPVMDIKAKKSELCRFQIGYEAEEGHNQCLVDHANAQNCPKDFSSIRHHFSEWKKIQDLHIYRLGCSLNSSQFSNDCNYKRHESRSSKTKSGKRTGKKIWNKKIDAGNACTSLRSP